MLSENPSIGQFITFIHQKEYNIDVDIKIKTDKIVDIIKYRIMMGQDLESIYSTLLDDVFALRMLFLKWAHKQKKTVFGKIQKLVLEDITRNLKLNNFPELNTAWADALEIYHHILTPLSLSLEPNANAVEILEEIHFDIDRNMMNLVLSFLPLPWRGLWRSFIEESLKMELSFMMADLVISSKVKMLKKEFVHDLAKFVENTTKRYAAYAMVIGIWKPENIYENQSLNNIAILASTIELKNGLHKKDMSLENLKMLIF